MLRKMILSVACVLMVAASAQAVPVVLFEDNASGEFGATGTLDSTNPFSGSQSWQVTYGAWATHGFEMLDGQASIDDIVNNDVSLWYRTDTGGNAQFNIGAWTGSAVATLTDNVTMNLTGDGEWHELLIDFSDGGSGLDPTVDRDLRLRPRDFSGNARVINWDLVTVTPEPASLALLGLGGLVMLRRRRA